MSLKPIQLPLEAADFFQDVRRWCTAADPEAAPALQLKGAVGSVPAFLLNNLLGETSGPVLCVMADEEAAAYLLSDLEQVARQPDRLLRFPASGQKPYNREQIQDPAPLIQRADVLQRLAEGFEGAVVTSVEALFEKVPPPETVQHEATTIATGEVVDPEELVERLVGQGFERVEFVEEPGELALRGGIVDVYPFAGEYPIRIEFFGDEIDSIREFEAATQRSISRRSAARIVPNLERMSSRDGQATTFTSFFDYLPPTTLLALFDQARLAEIADERFRQAEGAFGELDDAEGQPAPDVRYLSGAALEAAFMAYARLLFGTFVDAPADETFHFDARPQPDFNANLGLLHQRLARNAAEGIDTFVLCDSQGQESRLRELLEEEVENKQVRLTVESLHEGFEVPSLGLAVYTDHQIFNRYHRPTARKRKKKSGGLSIRDLQNLSPGDFVVHIDYGIGKFAGMEKIEVRGKQQESVRVLFAGGDRLYVNVNALYKLHKYTGKEGHQPRLTKLGSGQWEKTKAKTKKRVKDIARDLIALYAKRKASRGHAFSPDSVWQRELEASFQFEDTPDQATAAQAVKEDMEQPTPMDRLVCGDVGFGKTEVAIRAAFKAAQEGKQVGVLVPTTILAAQHYETFKKRLASFPIKVGVLSRFQSKEEQKATVEGLADGTIDIVIGTHRLTSKDVQFKHLGLLIIDEEQRFGVQVKEKLRKLRAEVDTLTLTATPIPRTLQFSLLGARDLSIISTPPPNRQPIITEIHSFDKDLIRDAILYETSRGGQVFFIHNRVRSIDEIASTLQAIVPDVRIRVAHGQMKGSDLEQVMLDFVEHRFDVLVSTNIIENGLDIANANTIIINHAQRFGLSELHQLRGRVGRSNQKAFAYLLVPSVHALTREARQRLQAVEEFSDLGSGFNLAMRDLDIRGAGDMLGAEQSGFIEDVGFETYHKILDEAVQELRADEFSDVFDGAPMPPVGDTNVDVEEDAFIPEGYLANNVERLNLYRRIAEADAEEALDTIRTELVDRFGPIPPELDHLLAAAEMRLLAQTIRLPKVTFKNARLFLDMPSQEDDPFFYERRFHPLLERLNGLDRRYVLRDKKGGKLRAIVQDVQSLGAAKAVLERLMPEDVALAA